MGSIFHEKEGDKGTFGTNMSLAMHKSREGKDKSEDGEKDKKASISEHLTKAEEHLHAAKAAHEGEEKAEEHEESDEGEMGGGSALESLMGGSEEED